MQEITLRRIGWALSAAFGLFMLAASAAPKRLGMPVAAQTMADLGWPDAPLRLIGALELICTLLYLFPPTALLGATLMMAILGGAIATQLQAASPLASHTLFGVYLGTLMWAGLLLRDRRLREMFPIRK